MACQSPQHWNRRTLLTAGLQAGVTAAAATSMCWLTPLATKLAHAQERAPDSQAPAKSVILLWMQGGPSQRDTFDPQPQASEIYSGPRCENCRDVTIDGRPDASLKLSA